MIGRILAALAILCCAGNLQAQSPGELKGHTALIYSVAFSPNGKILATGGYDNLINLWDVSSGKELRTLTGHSSNVYCVCFSPHPHTLPPPNQDQTTHLL